MTPQTGPTPSTGEAADRTGDFVSANNTASDGVPLAQKVTQEQDALLSMRRPPQDGELGRLSGFKITSLLGRGGMDAVLAAEDPLLGRPAAEFWKAVEAGEKPKADK